MIRLEVPEFKRCCHCAPLRYGLLVWAYIKTIFSFLMAVSIGFDIDQSYRILIRFLHNADITQIVIISLIFDTTILCIIIIDIFVNVLFLIGGHMKNVRLLTIQYHFSKVVLGLYCLHWIATLVRHIVDYTVGIFIVYEFWIFISIYLMYIVVHTYVLLLARSEIFKLRSNCKIRFVNDTVESECAASIRQFPEFPTSDINVPREQRSAEDNGTRAL